MPQCEILREESSPKKAFNLIMKKCVAIKTKGLSQI